jgi:polysaccharide pyruvyl transferase WcaK-like protein
VRIVAIGDIGVVDGMIHIGDEAMFGALVAALRSRGVESITGISSNPAESADRYGIDAVEPIGFGSDRAQNEARMRDALGPAPDPRARAVVEAVRAADAVVVAGGGNMTSLWPHHVFERATLGAIAAALGKPLVVTGQTIGPVLDAADGALVTGLLDSARLVGLREPSSLELVRGLSTSSPASSRAELTIDDASYLVDEPAAIGDYCLVSLASHVGAADRDAVVRETAALLDGLGMPVRFLAHFGSLVPGESRGDSVMHDRVMAAMRSPATVVTPTDSEAAARLARGASFVVSSRYHPVVFAVPAGVPALGIPVDGYTGVKLRGALGNFGQDGLLPVDELVAGRGGAVASGVLARREEIRSRAAQLSPSKRAASADWWDRVAAALATPHP